MDPSQPRSRLHRSISARPAPLRRSSSLFGVFGRVPWVSLDDDNFSSSGEDEPPAPPSPAVSIEEAKASVWCVLFSVQPCARPVDFFVSFWAPSEVCNFSQLFFFLGRSQGGVFFFIWGEVKGGMSFRGGARCAPVDDCTNTLFEVADMQTQ